MNQSTYRIGNFTSSQIYRLMGAPKPRKTYIAECNYARKLGRSLNSEHSARPTTWGKLCERRAFDILPLEYQLTSLDTITHPEYSCWAGSPDGVSETAVYDIKCPYTLKSFCELNEIKTAFDLREEHPDYFWQLVSNAVLTGKDEAELIIYCPYKSELDAIRMLCNDMPQDEIYKYFWIANANDDELPYIREGGYYQNLYFLRFKVTAEMKDELTQAVVTYSAELWNG